MWPTMWNTGDPASHPQRAGDPVLLRGGAWRRPDCHVDPRSVFMWLFVNAPVKKSDTWEGVEEKEATV